MELRHLRYFVAVASELRFGRAAERLFVSQPALSQQIRSLEGELGLKLLERNRRGVRLTPEGEAFLAEAKAVVQQAARAAAVARALAEGAAGHLRLSYGPPPGDRQDIRNTIPRFTTEARQANQALVELLGSIAQRKHATPAQIAERARSWRLTPPSSAPPGPPPGGGWPLSRLTSLPTSPPRKEPVHD